MKFNNTYYLNDYMYSFSTRLSFSFLINFLLLLIIFQQINNKNTDKRNNFNRIPDDLKNAFRYILTNKTQDCFNEIAFIYKKDYKDSSSNPYKNLANQERSLNRTLTQISKKLTKYDFYQQKNFSGIRWINPKSYSGEIKRLLEMNFQHIINYFDKNYFNCKSSVPEFIVENYNFFFTKFNEIRKSFQKFHLFKGIRKFMKCMAKSNSSYQSIHFGENLLSGKITVKKMLNYLKNIILAILDILKGNNIDNFSKALRKIIVNLKGLPAF